MLKRDELKGPSCLTSAADDEPIFVLKSTDELAPNLVRDWAQRYRIQKTWNGNDWTEKQQAKYHEAIALADKMETWRDNRARPDGSVPSSHSSGGVGNG